MAFVELQTSVKMPRIGIIANHILINVCIFRYEVFSFYQMFSALQLMDQVGALNHNIRLKIKHEIVAKQLGYESISSRNRSIKRYILGLGPLDAE